ncbi:shikimate kinase [Candidatus Gracilibacteria bacterium]|nr:shikimate kinase [Candidatus Gracilibacteria bacterium]MCF7856534.1 shikimate kinase [Candidatus Gracilibacteria bacterium]MCF7896857.1 shikimate kinase [Candidatus Gracilibacteria bacterium]
MNILLIGMPGSGKTRIGKMLARKLECDFIDVDEFILQETGKDSAEHLTELGDAEFLKFEAVLVKKINVENTVIAASGSVPLVAEGIEHLKKNAFAIWLRPPIEVLKKRVTARRDGATRIVGMQTRSFEEIWAWREVEYQKHHHAILETSEETPKEEVVEKLIEILKKNAVA